MKLFAILNTNNVKTYGGAQPFRQVVLFVFVPFDKYTLGDVTAIRDNSGNIIATLGGMLSGAVATVALASTHVVAAAATAALGMNLMFSSYQRKPAAPRIHSGSRKSAYDKAFYKGGKKEPVFHPNEKFGPHFHPANLKFKHWHYYFSFLLGLSFDTD